MKIVSSIKSLFLIIVLAFSLTSCEALGDVFKAGMWIGIIIVVAVIAIIFWIMRKLRR